jgi:hypothetical protein
LGVFDLGGLAAAAKSLLGGASAVKVAAGVTAVTAALVAGPSLARVPDPEQPSHRASAAVGSAGLLAPPVAAPDRRVARPLPGRVQERRADQGRPRRDSRPDARSSRQQPASEGTPASDPAPVADAAQSAGGTGENVVEGTTGAVGGVVGSASGTVEGVVDTATGTLDGAVDGTGLVPEVEDVVGDLSEQAGGVVNGLPPLLP